MLGKKDGLATKEEVKVLWKIASGKINIPIVLRPIANIVMPNIIDGLDNRVGDRIPEPWQTHCEQLVTLTVAAVEDEVITLVEAESIAEYAANVLNERIDLPLLKEDAEALVFMESMRILAVFLFTIANERKKETV
jgi:hypothetical protein